MDLEDHLVPTPLSQMGLPLLLFFIALFFFLLANSISLNLAQFECVILAEV